MNDTRRRHAVIRCAEPRGASVRRRVVSGSVRDRGIIESVNGFGEFTERVLHVGDDAGIVRVAVGVVEFGEVPAKGILFAKKFGDFARAIGNDDHLLLALKDGRRGVKWIL